MKLFSLIALFGSLFVSPTTFATMDRGAYGWRMTFEDHFDNASDAIQKGADPTCFSRNAICMDGWWTEKCKIKDQLHLGNLNKCNWMIYDRYNWMDYDAKEGTGYNAFHPSQVDVQDGYLHLKATRSPFSENEFECKTPYFDTRMGEKNYRKKCPIWSGGIESRHFWSENQRRGFQQQFGRFEVRLKISRGPGSWPAAWLLASETVNIEGKRCGWPHTGEIDIMEATESDPNGSYSTIHAGDCLRQTHLNRAFRVQERSSKFYERFHTYAAEWDENGVEFFLDGKSIGSVNSQTWVDGKDSAKNSVKEIINIPNSPFHWILNNTILHSESWPKHTRPDDRNFKDQDFIVDYVRTYEACTEKNRGSDCVSFGRSEVISKEQGRAKADINLYPNPARAGETIHLRYTLKQDCGLVSARVFSPTGSEIPLQLPLLSPVKKDSPGLFTIPTQLLRPGLYSISLRLEQCQENHQDSGLINAKFLILE